MRPCSRAGSVRPIATSPKILDAHALNRALLARQWLLEPRRATALEAIEQLVGLQAQDVKAPYFQLWARLVDFGPQELSMLLEQRAAVRIVLMRGTIHLVSARDALLLRPLMHDLIGRATEGNWSVGDVDRAALAIAGRELVETEPRTFAQLGALLAERFPDADPPALAQQIRALVPLVQVPPRGLWGQSGAAAHTSIEQWLDGVDVPQPSLGDLIRRYLGAFGPASVQDMQKWSGLSRLRPAFEDARSELVSFSDAVTGRELFDLPVAPRPPGDTPVPPRLVGPFDNLILSHADATRVLPTNYRRLVMTQNGLIAGMVLIDGFVAGNWRIKTTKKQALLTITSFSGKAYKKTDTAELQNEGERLLRFAAPDAPAADVVFSAG
ncbi:winged helix DNA-binding domain-containing protein [Baekduia sp.]|uniref:winged helix DNA-binding domain-containing protein n=1 Tax=Baekduia sp. TaxID=2600305 RepID=UPI002DFC2FE4|nr:winged helix DNA-binding domain-containing protein [Baekduia sp.]